MADDSQKLLKKYKFAKKFRIMETVKLVSEITSKTKQENPNRTMEKNLILVPHFFFSKIWLHQSPDVMVSYHHVHTILEKT